MTVRTYRIGIQGFPFDHVFVRAKSPARARTICARAFSYAGYGTMIEGYKTLTSTRLDGTLVVLELPYSPEETRADGMGRSEGMARALTGACPELTWKT